MADRLDLKALDAALHQVENSSPKILSTPDLQGVVEYIQQNNCRNIITMAGAGISTSAGIPDFRSPGTGLYDNLQQYNLPYPEAVFTMSYFHAQPEPFFLLAKELYPGNFDPTPCHHFIKLLQDQGRLLRHYTQNIDTLERVAGVDGDKLVEAHGSFASARCVGLGCRKEHSADWVKTHVMQGTVPKCDACQQLVKPDIVFFGENLPARFGQLIGPDFKQCDLLIVLGTSLTVNPFASLVDMVPSHVPRLLINRDKVGHFDFSSGSRDAVHLGTCDDGCRELATLLGWAEEFDRLIGAKRTDADSGNNNTAESSDKAEQGPRRDSAQAVTPVTASTDNLGNHSATSEAVSAHAQGDAHEEGNDKQKETETAKEA